MHRVELLLSIISLGCLPLLAPAARAATAAGSPDPTGGVYVRDSDVAVEKFALADRLEHLGEWGKAADVYQEMLQKLSDRVIASPNDPSQFQSVAAAVQDHLAHWPADGLNVYRDRYGPEARSLLEAAEAEHRADGVDDAAGLHRVLARYFVTDAAKAAGIRLIDGDIENGDFSAATGIGRRLLDAHPMLLDDRPRILFRTGLALHLMGNGTADEGAAAELAELRQKFPAALGRVRGADVVLADALATELKQHLAPPIASRTESWPMPFGAPDRAAAPAVNGLAGALMFSIPLDDVLARGALRGIVSGSGQRQAIAQQQDRERVLGLTIDSVPVVDRGELFFQDNAHVYAVSLESGYPLPGWQETYPGAAAGRYSVAAWPMPRSEPCCLCLTDDSVLGVMGLPDAMSAGAMMMRAGHDTRLVCLDRRNGRERWVSEPARLPADPPALRQLNFTGVPLVVGDDVYVLGRGGEGVQFDDCYIVCLDRATGAYKWATYLASANDNAPMMDMEGGGASSTMTFIAYAGGRLYVSTNVGAMAALDASNGTIDWLNLYPRDRSASDRFNRGRFWARQAETADNIEGKKPWTNNPVVVRDGKVYALPADADSLLVYDADTGALLRKIGLSYSTQSDDARSERAETFVGIAGDHGQWAVLASDRSVFCVDLAHYDPAKGNDNLRWAETFANDKSKWPDDSIRGRPFLTRESLIVPLAWGLKRIDLYSGNAVASFPASGTWDVKVDGPGNVLLTPDHLVIAGDRHVNVYADLSVATGRLDREIAASPDDPLLRLRYAEVLLAARHFTGPAGALSKLDEAAKLMGLSLAGVSASTTQGVGVPTTNTLEANSSGAMPPEAENTASVSPSSRTRLFNDALNFAMTAAAAADAANVANVANVASAAAAGNVVDQLYDRAGEAASSAAEQVTYRLRRAEHDRRANDPAAELALDQQILVNPQWRDVTVAGGNSGNGPAGAVVRLSIAALLQRAGDGLYRPYESKADQLLAALRSEPASAERAARLQSLADAYPNAAAARQAMQLAAGDDETAGDPRAAATVLRDFFTRYPDSVQRAYVLEALARLYLQMPNRSDRLSVAIGRLEQGAKIPNVPRLQQPLKLPDGTVLDHVTFDEAAAALRKFQADAETRALPDPLMKAYDRSDPSAPPFVEVPGAAIAGVEAVISPLPKWARDDRLITFDNRRGLSVYAVGSSTPLFTVPMTEAPLHAAWIGSNLLAWSPSRMLMIHADGAAITPAASPASTQPTGGQMTAAPGMAAARAQGTIAGTVAGAVIWDVSLRALPVAQVASVGGGEDGSIADGGDSSDNLPGDDSVPQQNQPVIRGGIRNPRLLGGFAGRINGGFVNGQPVVINGRVVFVPGNGNIVLNTPAAPAVEQIEQVEPGMDRVVISTAGATPAVNGAVNGPAGIAPPINVPPANGPNNLGVANAAGGGEIDGSGSRIISLSLTDGHVVWQTRLADQAVDRIAANDDFVAARTVSDSQIQLLALDAQTGQPVWRPKPFSRDNNDTAVPINFALAPDGSLVYLMADRVCCKDLFDPNQALRFDRSVSRGSAADTFSRALDPDQLLVDDGRIIAISDAGTFVRIYNLSNGHPYTRGPDSEPLLGTGVTDSPWNAHLRLVGENLYVFGPTVVTHYNLDNAAADLPYSVDATKNVNIEDAILTPPAVLLLLAPKDVQPIAGASDLITGNPRTVTIRGLSRLALSNGHESGLVVNHDFDMTAQSGIADVEILDGGIYYLDGDHHLHFLAGGAGGKAEGRRPKAE